MIGYTGPIIGGPRRRTPYLRAHLFASFLSFYANGRLINVELISALSLELPASNQASPSLFIYDPN